MGFNSVFKGLIFTRHWRANESVCWVAFKSISLFIVGKPELEWPWKVIKLEHCKAEPSPVTAVTEVYVHTVSEQPTAEELT